MAQDFVVTDYERVVIWAHYLNWRKLESNGTRFFFERHLRR